MPIICPNIDISALLRPKIGNSPNKPLQADLSNDCRAWYKLCTAFQSRVIRQSEDDFFRYLRRFFILPLIAAILSVDCPCRWCIWKESCFGLSINNCRRISRPPQYQCRISSGWFFYAGMNFKYPAAKIFSGRPKERQPWFWYPNSNSKVSTLKFDFGHWLSNILPPKKYNLGHKCHPFDILLRRWLSRHLGFSPKRDQRYLTSRQDTCKSSKMFEYRRCSISQCWFWLILSSSRRSSDNR